MLLAMNGFSESDSNFGFVTYIILAIVVTLVMSSLAALTVRRLSKGGFGALSVSRTGITSFTVVGLVVKLICSIIGVLLVTSSGQITVITSYNDFWDFYVREHSNPLTRLLHFIGTSLGIVLLAWFIVRGTWYYFPLCFICGYAFAWFAHFVVEKNRPATFQYPFWSFISDYKMMWYMATGRMGKEVERVSKT